MAHIAFPMVLAIIVLLVYNIAGIRKQGFGRYFKDVMFIPGVPKFVYHSDADRIADDSLHPAVHADSATLREHVRRSLLLLVFVTGAEYMLLEVANPALRPLDC